MKINTASDCRAAKAVVMKALSAINAREREIHWRENPDPRYSAKTVEQKAEAAHAKVLEDLAEFRELKDFADGVYWPCMSKEEVQHIANRINSGWLRTFGPDEE